MSKVFINAENVDFEHKGYTICLDDERLEEIIPEGINNGETFRADIKIEITKRETGISVESDMPIKDLR